MVANPSKLRINSWVSANWSEYMENINDVPRLDKLRHTIVLLISDPSKWDVLLSRDSLDDDDVFRITLGATCIA